MKGIANGRVRPNWDFFHDASLVSLQSFELSRLNNAANIRREIAALLDQWIDDNSQAMLARWVREQRSLPQPPPAAPAALEATPGSLLDPSPLPGEPASAPAQAMLPRPAARSPQPAARSPRPARTTHR
jgi:hypothetical protein